MGYLRGAVGTGGKSGQLSDWRAGGKLIGNARTVQNGFGRGLGPQEDHGQA